MSPCTSSLCSYISCIFWSSGIMDCICLHLEIEFRSCARGRQWCCIFSLPLINRFNKTDAGIFFMQAVIPEDFPFSQFNFDNSYFSVKKMYYQLVLEFFMNLRNIYSLLFCSH